jgi:hypothetical protein
VGPLYHPENIGAIVRPSEKGTNPELEEIILSAALQNLDKYFITGITERFKESVVIMAKKLGWKLPIQYKRTNIGGPKPNTSAEAIESIKEESQSDYILYNRACVLLDRHISEYEGDFEADLKSVKDLTYDG